MAKATRPEAGGNTMQITAILIMAAISSPFIMGEVSTIEDEHLQVTALSSTELPPVRDILRASDGGWFALTDKTENLLEKVAWKISPAGEILWRTELGFEGEQDAAILAETPDGGMIAGDNIVHPDACRSLHMTGLSPTGEQLWTKEWEPDERYYGHLAAAGGVLILGNLYDSGNERAIARFVDYDGNTIWEYACDLNGFNHFTCAARTSNGYILGGVHHDMDATPANEGLLVEIDTEGREIGRVLFSAGEGYRDLGLYTVAVLPTGETVAGGTALQEGGGRLGFDALLVLHSDTTVSVDHYGLQGENRESVYRVEEQESGKIFIYIKALGDDYGELTRLMLPAAISR
ncbi:MAG TPA: hypothetical protein PK907_08805 [Candidatus Sabulitectum sp.]|nr:hypothetical protein [Candidatus Sabulitectum sp.]